MTSYKLLLSPLLLAAVCQASHAPQLSASSSIFERRQSVSATSIVRRFFHGSFVLGNHLYIDGGECTTTDWQIANQVYNDTLAIDLSTSFSTTRGSSPPSTRIIDKGECPNFNLPAYWVDEATGTVYTYGGQYSYLNNWIGTTTVPVEALWAFSADNGGSWTNVDQSLDTVFTTLTRPSYGGFTYGKVGGFYLGGRHGSRGSQKTDVDGYTAAPGIQFFNFTDRSWTNASTQALTNSGTFIQGSIQYVPTWGDAGLVVVLGGQECKTLDDCGGGRYLSWSNISIFDPATHNWYFQAATGAIPGTRYEFCNVGVGANLSNGTYEIYVYGGQSDNPEDAATEGDALYILSLPAFQWFKTDATTGDPRKDHSCNIAGKSQMLSVGGLNPTLNSTQIGPKQTSEQMNATDPYVLGIKVLDLPSLTWTNIFNPSSAAYTPPQVIRDYYGGQLKYPAQWNQQSLKSIFISDTTNGTTPTPSPSPPGTGSSHTGAIAGGVVGGVIGLALIAVAVWFFFIRKSPAKSSGPSSSTATEEKDPKFVAEDKIGSRIGELESPPDEGQTRHEMAAPRSEHKYLHEEQGLAPRELPAAEQPQRGHDVYEM